MRKTAITPGKGCRRRSATSGHLLSRSHRSSLVDDGDRMRVKLSAFRLGFHRLKPSPRLRPWSSPNTDRRKHELEGHSTDCALLNSGKPSCPRYSSSGLMCCRVAQCGILASHSTGTYARCPHFPNSKLLRSKKAAFRTEIKELRDKNSNSEIFGFVGLNLAQFYS